MIRHLVLLLAVLLPLACVDTEFSAEPVDAGWSFEAISGCAEGTRQCSGNTVQVCKGNTWTNEEVCYSPKVCASSLKKCVECDPLMGVCKGDDLYTCNTDGTLGAKTQTCPAGMCQSGRCVDPCSQAKGEKSYIGCTYWPTVTANANVVEDFEFAVAVANANSTDAKVTVSTSTNAALATQTVPAKSVVTIKLPWVLALKMKTAFASTQATGAAYKLVSTLPVTVYQFNALDYVLTGDCKKGTDQNPGDGKCYSYTNDASLLLPDHALEKEYLVVSRPSMGIKRSGQMLSSPGFLSVVATQEGTTTVTIAFTANTMAGGGGLTAYTKGQTGTFTLKQWDVLQILSQTPTDCTPVKTDTLGTSYCDLSSTTDLTGTVVKSDKAVALFSGHNCSFVPYDKWACDHLEEQVFPLNALGKRYVGSHPTSSGKDPGLYRVVSAVSENIITFDPPVYNTVTLQKGSWIEFESTKDFEVTGTGRFALISYMVGQNYSVLTPGDGAPNDPAMALGVPVEQYRVSYSFLAPASYAQNYVNIHAPVGATVKLDGTALTTSQFTSISSTSGYQVAKLKISGGSHIIDSTSKTGITVYGVGSYTSYMYPGGLDLKALE